MTELRRISLLIVVISAAIILVILALTFFSFNLNYADREGQSTNTLIGVALDANMLDANMVDANPRDGELIFKSKCAACHKLYKEAMGPALFNFLENHRSLDMLYFTNFVNKEDSLLSHGNQRALQINGSYSRDFTHDFKLSERDISDLLSYSSGS